MLKRSPLFRRFALFFATVFLTACGGGSDNDPDPTPRVTPELEVIQITPAEANMVVGTSEAFTATAVYDDGTSADVTESVTWTSSATDVATVGNSGGEFGQANALAPGETTVTAAMDGVSGTARITVVEAELQSLEISPEAPVIGQNTSVQLSAIGLFSNGSSQNLTDSVTWESANPEFVSIDETGLATSVAPGTSTVTATLNDMNASTGVTVTDSPVVELEIEPDLPAMGVGTRTQLTALARFENNLTQDVTGSVAWSTSDPNVVQVAEGEEAGMASAQAPGSASISATLGGVNATESVTVTDAALSRIQVTPMSPVLVIGAPVRMAAYGVYADGLVQPLTDQVTWTSSDPVILTLSNAENSQGTAWGVQPGQAVALAEFNGIQGSTTVDVSDAALASVDVQPVSPVIGVGNQAQMTAIGHFDNGVRQNVTQVATWISTNKDVATVSNREGAKGLVSAAATGQVRVSATVDGVPGFMPVTVTDAALQSIAITPPTSQLAPGTTVQLRAVGSYADGTEVDLTKQVFWSTDVPASAVVSNAEGDEGLVTALAAGSSTVTAYYPGTTADATSTIQVSDATLESITVTPAQGLIPVEKAVQYQAMGQFSDGTEQDLTDRVTWATGDANIATVSNGDGGRGLVKGVQAGNTAVQAQFNEASASTDVSVVDQPGTPVAISLEPRPNVILANDTDTSLIRAYVGGAGEPVADGTVVQFSVPANTGVLSSVEAPTVDGVASVLLTTSQTGVIPVTATVANQDLESTISVHGVAELADALHTGRFVEINMTDNLVPAGARFGSFISNLSNRVFGLDTFTLMNGSREIVSRTDPDVLSGNELTAGEGVGFVVRTQEEQPDEGFVATYNMTDRKTNQDFDVVLPYNLSQP